MGIWPFLIIMGLWSLLSIFFAFKEPSPRVGAFFRVPAIFVFLPEKWVMPAGRLVAGLCGLGLVGYLWSLVG